MSLIIMILGLLSSFNSQDTSVEDIKGNWLPFSLQKEEGYRYIKIFIDDTTFNYYKIGILSKKKFGIKDNSLFLENFKTNQLQEMGTLTYII